MGTADQHPSAASPLLQLQPRLLLRLPQRPLHRPAAGNAALSEDVAKWVAKGRKWSKSTIAAEQARRGRKGLPALNDVEIAALLGEPVESERRSSGGSGSPSPRLHSSLRSRPAHQRGSRQVGCRRQKVEQVDDCGGTSAAQSQRSARTQRCRNCRSARRASRSCCSSGRFGSGRSTAARLLLPPGPRGRSRAASAAASVARSGASTSYVGTPAVGTSERPQPGGVASIGPEDNEVNQQRRRLVWSAVAAFLVAWFLAFFRFFLPRTLFEPATSFKIGYPEEYGLGVDTKFQQKYRIWVDRTPDRIFVIYARCTHLGCTPDWKPSENKFKCPCHGSGYDSEGINFEGPAPRPMDEQRWKSRPTARSW